MSIYLFEQPAKRASELEDVQCEVVDMTPQMARFIRDTCVFERQRAIDPRNVTRLHYEMERGYFIPGTPIFLAVLPDNSMLLLNGNHTCEALAINKFAVTLTLIYKRVANLDEAAKIYVNMDIHKTRGWASMLLASGLKDKVHLASKVLPAVGLIQDNYEANSNRIASRIERIKAMEEYEFSALTIHAAWEGTPKHMQNFINRAPFMAVALMTAKWQPKAAEEFWGGAAKDDGLSKTDPRKMLLNYGMTNKSVSKESRHRDVRAAAICWNAFFENRTLEVIKPSQMKDVRILGTPWHKGKPEEKPVKAVEKVGKNPKSIKTGVKKTASGEDVTVMVYDPINIRG